MPDSRGALLFVVLLAAAGLARQIPGRGESVPERLCPGSLRVDERAPANVRLTLGRRLDPNRDDARSLALLPGVGPRLAERVVRERPFERIDDLIRVPGVGPRTLERLRGWLAIPEEKLEVPEQRTAQGDGHVRRVGLEVGDQ